MNVTDAAKKSQYTGLPYKRPGKESPVLKSDAFGTKRVDLEGEPSYSFTSLDLSDDGWELVDSKREIGIEDLKDAWEKANGSSRGKKFKEFTESLGYEA